MHVLPSACQRVALSSSQLQRVLWRPSKGACPRAMRGAAIVTGVNGERWPVTRERFERACEPDQGTQAANAGLYLRQAAERLAHQLKAVARVALSGGRGDLTAGAGDWLVEYSPGDRALVCESVFRQ